MSLYLITFLVMLLIVVAMAIGVMAGRKPLQGSCGGLNKIEGLGECEICGGDRQKCDEFSREQS
ncbi:MAG: (Na+)-NQR maturation NqrM [Proteobacteria bacterium]|nr:(Na+)-NQR maturation NqrM [Pseudomonadota bacterium]MDA0928951.1 (Na+)-NQR maturation NqrM [Pseudomonadota bacterium]